MQENQEGIKESQNSQVQQENLLLKRKLRELTLKSQLSQDQEFRYQDLIVKSQLIEQLEKSNQLLNGIGQVLSNIGKVLDERLGKQKEIPISPVMNPTTPLREELSEEEDDLDDEDNQNYSYDEEEVPEIETKAEDTSSNWYDPSPPSESKVGRKKK